MKLFDNFFGRKETMEALGGDQTTYEETARQQGAPWGVGVP